jgi:hypothetical protein
MGQPSDVLRQHAAMGRKLHSDLLVARQSRRSADSNVALGVDALDFFFDLSGRKRLARGLGKSLVRSSVDGTIRELESKTDGWIAESKVILGRISVLRRGIPSKPNSQELVCSFSAQMRFAKPETRLSHGISYLENLAESKLILNDEIEQTRNAVTAVQQLPLSPPTGIESGLNELQDLVSPFPAVAEAVAGAVSVYQRRNPDWGRQAVGSMRNALETLIKILSGESDWRTGLEKIMTSNSARKQIHVTYAMLSARGVHSEEVPTEDDVLFCIRLTQEEIKYIIKCYASKKKAG